MWHGEQSSWLESAEYISRWKHLLVMHLLVNVQGTRFHTQVFVCVPIQKSTFTRPKRFVLFLIFFIRVL